MVIVTTIMLQVRGLVWFLADGCLKIRYHRYNDNNHGKSHCDK